ncbi:MAG: hypothetical protein RQ753_06985 [Desulfurivibrionaceae bacterium]|nr:hypothetical protein [Desulfobulbales bacterium]MDT8335425.1 hypothetical protein [Desulfurivibrionaceae bacterium]
MRKEEVPQDRGIAGGLKEVAYAVDENGRYVKVASAGWEPKNISNYQAWEIIAGEIAATRRKVEKGELSPLAYHMARNLMDDALLAQYMGIMRWRVRRHLKAKIFKKLGNDLLERYASLLKVTVAQLRDIDLVDDPEIPGRDRE